MVLPNLYYFNPTCDIAIANNTVSYKPNRLLTQFETDLAFLPNYLAHPQDVILVPKYEDLNFLGQLYKMGFSIAGQVLRKEVEQENQRIFSEIGRFVPWGWSTNMIHRFKKMGGIESQEPLPTWSDSIRDSMGRNSAMQILNNILNHSYSDIYILPQNTPQKLTEFSDIEYFIKNNYPVVLKEPWSSSARGNMVFRKALIGNSHKQRIRSVLNKQGFWMGEKWHHKIADFSMHFVANQGQFQYVGESYFQTDSNGQYQASYIGQKPHISALESDFLDANLPQIQQDLNQTLNNSSLFDWYQGNMGVDLMLVEENNQLKIHPCVEINLRNTMGTVALAIQKQLHPKAKGVFKIIFDPNHCFEKQFDHSSIAHQMLDEQLYTGNIPLCYPKGKQFGAVLVLT